MLASAVVSLIYGVHLLWSWGFSAMANLDQVAVIGFYLVAGLVAGEIIMREALRRWQRDEIIRRSYLAEQARERENSRMDAKPSEKTPAT